MKWNPHSWRKLPIVQVPEYSDTSAVKKVEKQLANLPPLVFAGEVIDLRERLADVALGKAFLLQGGDCAESFDDFSPTKSATPSGCFCRWRWCSPLVRPCR